jgi:hypothetical protein
MTTAAFMVLGAGYLASAGCGAQHDLDADPGGSQDDLTACSLQVTHNSYDGPNFWGTITVKNKGPASATGFSVEFDVPSGVHCTNDAVPSGASLSPLNGSGTSATTKSNHCKFTWASAKLASGASKTFNYSTDSSSFSSASKVTVTSNSCTGGGGSTGTGGSGSTTGTGSGTGGTPPTGCNSPGLVWKSANKTNFTSYPAPGSEECIKFSGCMFEGQFASCSGVKSKNWVRSHNIVAVFPDRRKLNLHDLCLKSGSKTIVVTVYDECGDQDCDGCCTENKGSADELIDIESFTDDRWGVPDGRIQWADLGPTKGDGCAGN